MKKTLAAAAVLASTVLMAPAAYAGSPHFVDASFTSSGNTVTVQGKEAGLGNETQVHIEMVATASCINGGGHHPKAVNKTSVTAAGDFPVQNGKAIFTLSGTAVFQPDCAPPMTVAFGPVTITDTEHNVSVTLN